MSTHVHVGEWCLDCVDHGVEIRAASEAAAPRAATEPEWPDLANAIRIVDGKHDLGAGALAEALTARGWTRAATEPHPPDVRGWLVLGGPLQNQHVIPAEQQGTDAEHEPSVACWCLPRRADPDSPDLMGGDVYLHRRTHDHGHAYKDSER